MGDEIKPDLVQQPENSIDSGEQIKDDSRAKLVQTAISFLQNPKVRESPLSQKKSFLENKGLTPEEVKIALDQSGSLDEPRKTGNAVTTNSYAHLPPNAYAVQHYTGSTSRFTKFREFCTVVLVTGSTLYGIYQFTKKYIIPHIYGLPTEEERLQNLEKQMTAFQVNINETLAQLQNTLADLQITLQQICRKQDAIVQPQLQIPSNIDIQFKDLRSEITSLKGLLLNKHQFPAAPAINRIIPSWQMDQPESSILLNGNDAVEHNQDNKDDNDVTSC